jgi:two-component system response regulator FixJ
MVEPLRVALVDDDEAVLDSLRLYLARQGIAAACFASADAFLGASPAVGAFDCVVADVRMPGLSGLDLVRRLRERNISLPVVLITGHGDIDMAVSAIKLGAADFIEKPFDEARLLESVRNAAAMAQRRQSASTRLAELRARHDSLSERQREVMELAAAALSNKEIAKRLGISPRTVEIHRAWMMSRMGARNLAELVRMEMELKSGL